MKNLTASTHGGVDRVTRMQRMATMASFTGGKGFRVPSRDELRKGRSLRGQRREAVHAATNMVIDAQQRIERGIPTAGAELIKARKALGLACHA